METTRVMNAKNYQKAVTLCTEKDLEAWGVDTTIKPADEVFIIETFHDRYYEIDMVKVKSEIDDRLQLYFVLPKKFFKIIEDENNGDVSGG